MLIRFVFTYCIEYINADITRDLFIITSVYVRYLLTFVYIIGYGKHPKVGVWKLFNDAISEEKSVVKTYFTIQHQYITYYVK